MHNIVSSYLMPLEVATFDLINHENGYITIESVDNSIYKYKFVDQNGESSFGTRSIWSVTPYTGKWLVYGNLNKVAKITLWGDVYYENATGKNFFSGFQVTPATIKQFPNVKEVYIRMQNYQGTNPVNKFSVTGEFSDIPDSVENLTISIHKNAYTIGTFNLNNLRQTSLLKTILFVNDAVTTSGNIEILPSNLKQVTLTTGNYTGDFTKMNISQVVEVISFAGSNTITGTLDNVTFPVLNSLTITGNNTVSKLPNMPNLVSLNIAGSNTISSLPDMPKLENLTLFGNHTISVLPNLPSLVYTNFQGKNTVSVLPDLPNGVNISITGFNTISQIPDLPKIQSLEIGGYNTISTIPNLSTIINLTIFGQNTISSIPVLPKISYLKIEGKNTISVLPSLPTLTNLTLTGNNTLSSLANIPNVTTLYLYGKNTVSGNPFAVLPKLKSLEISGNNTITYSSVPLPATMELVAIVAGSALTTAMVDQMLIDFSNVNWASSKKITIKGNSQPRSSASDAAVAALVAKGVTVSTN